MAVREPMEQFARVGEIELAYETFGDPADAPVLMIQGIGAQMIYWPEGLCELLAESGYRVIRFDNRDAGHSTKLDGRRAPPLRRVLEGDHSGVPYLLQDMAADSVGLLGVLGIERAHVVGASMGGMIAQRVAIDFPERVLSLASIMSTTGDRAVGQATADGTRVLLTPPPPERSAYIDWFVAARRVIGSADHLFDEDATRRLAGRAYDRGVFSAGTMRQFAAILASPDRTPELAAIAAPTVVIHGERDALIGISGGRATAAAIPGAELVVIEDMGHDLPAGAWEAIADALIANFERATAPVAR
jgi:pimeloyl-ACP methyl ester carboxylesterase